MLIKKEAQETGFDAEYWDLSEIHFDLVSKTCTVQLHLYKSKAAKQAGKRHIREQRFEFPMNLFANAQLQDLRIAIRQALKAVVPFFDDAEND